MKGKRILPLAIISIISLITVLFALKLPELQIDNEVMNFVPKDEPALLALEDMQDQYGSALVIALVIENPYGSIISTENLKIVDQMTKTLEDQPQVSLVQSLTNTDYISGAGGTLTVSPLSRDSQGNFLSGDQVRQRLKSWDMYDKLLLSADGHSTQMGITLKEGLDVDQREALYFQIKDLARANLPETLNFYLAGLPATTIQISDNMRQDLILLIPFVVLLLLGILYLSFRKAGGVILPILNVLVSTIWTLGLMAWLEKPLSLLGSVIPVLMIAVGSAYGIHIVSHYYDERRHLTDGDKEGQRKAVLHTLKLVGVPVVMAGLTTIAGFGSLTISSVLPMKSFGIFTAFGVFSALLVSLTLIPSLLILHPAKASKEKQNNGTSPFLNGLSRFSTERKSLLILLTLFLLAGSVMFIPRIKVDNNIVEYFKESTEVRQSERVIRENFAGTNSFSILIKGKNPGDLTRPEILLFMDGMKQWMLQTNPEISKVLSYSDFIKRINQVLHEDSPGRLDLGGSDSGFSDSGFSDSSFSDSSFSGDSFSGDSFSGDSFSGDSFSGDSFSGDSFSGDSFSDSSFSDSSFSGDSFSGDSFSGDSPSRGAAAPAPGSEKSPLMEALWTSWLQNPDHFMEELARQTNYLGMDYLEIPENPEKYQLQNQQELSDLITQYLLLYSGNLTDWANEALEPSEARMSVQLSVNGSRYTDSLIPELQNYADIFLPEGYSITFAGTALVQGALTHLIVDSAIKSILISILLVFLILTFTYRSPLAGLIGIIPLTLTVLVNFGIMGLTGIKLDISTAMVGSIAIGIGIDYTIHFLSSYVHHHDGIASPQEVTSRAMHSSGKAILFNALSVAAGFAVLLFSRFNPLMYFGILIVMTMGISSLSALTLLPLLLNRLQPKFLNKMYEIEKKKERIA